MAIIDQATTPAEAILRVVVEPESVGPATEVRGRFMGPRCPYATTVEVAYPLRRLAGPSNPGELVSRVVIPEASLWEPESPFLYHGMVELWQDGQRCDQVAVSHGLRRVNLVANGLRINGRQLFLRGRALERCTEADALALRSRGINLWLVPVSEETVDLWDMAEHWGFLVLGQVGSASAWAIARRLESHASSLGWLTAGARPVGEVQGLIGLTTAESLAGLAGDRCFRVCSPNQAEALAAMEVPFLVLAAGQEWEGGEKSSCLGTVQIE